MKIDFERFFKLTQGTLILRLLQANSWNSLTVWVLTVQTRHNLMKETELEKAGKSVEKLNIEKIGIFARK